MNNPENDAALKALGIRKGMTYHVVPVSCTQKDCLSYAGCREGNAIGLADDEDGGNMICHEYETRELPGARDKKVFWQRVEPIK